MEISDVSTLPLYPRSTHSCLQAQIKRLRCAPWLARVDSESKTAYLFVSSATQSRLRRTEFEIEILCGAGGYDVLGSHHRHSPRVG